MSDPSVSQVGYAKRYFERYHHASRYLLLLEMARPQSDWKVLDLCCGPGSASYELSPCVKEVIAVDPSKEVVELASTQFQIAQIKNVEFKQMDSCKLDFSDESFDMVVSTARLHHSLDPTQMLREAKRVLKEKGVLAIWDLIGSKSDIRRSNQNLIEQLRDPSHIELLSEFEIHNLLRIIGMEVLDQQPMLLVRNLEEWLSLISPPAEITEKLSRLMKVWASHDEADLNL